ncbi:MAG TPA: T9SS type A sorting domain-containing protein [Candidatus Cloacimonadota bacterium]|nr:T9SS type A sorting domain-containing protein [Candidatus Cloacimonadota bacterium]
MKHLCVLFFCLSAVLCFATADIQVSYSAAFTGEQIAAFETAVSLWEPLLNSTVPIKINASWANLPGFTLVTLPNLIRNFAGAPLPNVWYSNALANALTGQELNPGQADCDFIISSNTSNSWYFGQDENCPVNQLDFISEMQKSVAYALGYQSSFYVQSGYGSYGMLDPSVLGLTPSFPWEAMQNQPSLYDTFVCNLNGQFLTNTSLFPNPSPALNAQLTSGNLRYQGTYGVQYAGEVQPQLYASAFNLARTARLLGTAYSGTENAPGVPSGMPGQVLRYPAPIVLGMLKDQGWNLDLSSLMPAPFVLFTLSENNLLLNWDEPDSPFTAHSYNITWNGSHYANSQESFLAVYNLSPGTHVFTVSSIYSTGESVPSEPVTVLIPTSVEDEIQNPAHQMSCAPNPFRSELQIRFDLKTPEVAHISVYDLRGRKLKQIFEGQLPQGEHNLAWNGTNAAGKRLSPGIYLLRLSSGGQETIRKVLLLP